MPIVDLDLLVPEELVFKYQGEQYRIPGDMPMDSVLTLAVLLQASEKAEGDAAAQRRLNPKVEKFLLDLFRILQPDLEGLPFGGIAYSIVIAQILELAGFTVESAPEDPTTPTPRRVGKAPARSRRSTGSRK